MKWSNFNFLFKSERYGYMIYNSFSNAFAEITTEVFEQLKKLEIQKYDIEKKNFKNDELWEALLQGKILVENDFNGISYLKHSHIITKTSPNVLGLTIAPTTDCNFKCNYCFELLENKKYMNFKTIEYLIDFIKKHNNIEKINITWYGGEPLLAFDKMIHITKEIKKLKINFSAGIVTNGYLLTEKVIDKLLFLNVNFLQITIDGVREEHNKNRPHINNKDSFSKIVSNINFLLKSKWRGSLSIRVNINNDNFENFNKVRSYIKNEFLINNNINIHVYPGYIQNIIETNSEKLSNCISNNEKFNFEYTQYQNDADINFSFFPDLSDGVCTANSFYSFIIGPEGEIYKCWNDVGNYSRIVGTIKEPHKLNNLGYNYLSIDPFSDKKCLSCSCLPICMGGCPYIRLMKTQKNTRDNLCSKFKNNILKYLESHYQRKLTLNNLENKKNKNEN